MSNLQIKDSYKVIPVYYVGKVIEIVIIDYIFEDKVYTAMINKRLLKPYIGLSKRAQKAVTENEKNVLGRLFDRVYYLVEGKVIDVDVKDLPNNIDFEKLPMLKTLSDIEYEFVRTKRRFTNNVGGVYKIEEVVIRDTETSELISLQIGKEEVPYRPPIGKDNVADIERFFDINIPSNLEEDGILIFKREECGMTTYTYELMD